MLIVISSLEQRALLTSYILRLTHEDPERHVSCLARHYFANARKMLWFCED